MIGDDNELDVREQVFHNAIREHVIFLLLSVLLILLSYVGIQLIRKKPDTDECYTGDEDLYVYKISLLLCTLTLAISFGAVLLLPISIVSNEVLLLYPDSYYVKWLNSSLIHELWNLIFFLSNLALFMLMPFSYFFTESEGFSGSRRGIMGRVYETAVVLIILGILVFGIAWVASALIDGDKSSRQTLFELRKPSYVWYIYLPYLYSCISFLGVLALLLCTPVGFARMFTVMGQLVVKPQFLHDIDSDLFQASLTEEDLLRKIKHSKCGPSKIANGTAGTDFSQRLEEVRKLKQELEKRKQVSSLRRNLGYPLVILILLALTAICVLMVSHNMFQLLIGIKALPFGTKKLALGITSLSALGPVGAVLEIILILYLMCASLVGFYSLPVFCHLTPRIDDTTMILIIANCIVILVLSSALPVLLKTLGITNFDLLGNFGSMEWLGNFYIILTYNIVFAVATALCLVNKFTATIRQEIYVRLKMVFKRERRSYSSQQILNGSLMGKED
ncbi:limb region 1 protein homolog isoform X1 [Octopus bimaculoides]|uniref:limb region 1 protein homolog isoform X1 n=1 Tax=Octopus bimaculoides TaxID=37653 RepID=UPI00071C28FE|nr:limb region 1 protein homolog isoform X1 [Octopus bimaculoides]|eukprot:XP_014788146.1 PREDICTED: limb region 1 protein homolog isoform X1 [Octopus bimaculoides]